MSVATIAANYMKHKRVIRNVLSALFSPLGFASNPLNAPACVTLVIKCFFFCPFPRSLSLPLSEFRCFSHKIFELEKYCTNGWQGVHWSGSVIVNYKLWINEWALSVFIMISMAIQYSCLWCLFIFSHFWQQHFQSRIFVVFFSANAYAALL